MLTSILLVGMGISEVLSLVLSSDVEEGPAVSSALLEVRRTVLFDEELSDNVGVSDNVRLSVEDSDVVSLAGVVTALCGSGAEVEDDKLVVVSVPNPPGSAVSVCGPPGVEVSLVVESGKAGGSELELELVDVVEVGDVVVLVIDVSDDEVVVVVSDDEVVVTVVVVPPISPPPVSVVAAIALSVTETANLFTALIDGPAGMQLSMPGYCAL